MRTGRVLPATLAALAVTISMTQPVGASAGWPQDGYDQGHSHANTREWRLRPDNVGRLRLLWSRPVRPPGVTPDEFLFEGVQVPVVRGAVFASWWGQEVDAPRLTALDPATGRNRWSRSTGWVVAAASADVAYVNADRRVVALDASSGERRWARWGIDVFAASSAIDRLFVRMREGLGVVDASDGRNVWARPDVSMGAGVVADGKVVVTEPRPGPDLLFAFDAETGDTAWRRSIWWRGARWSFPDVAADGVVYLVSSGRAVGDGTTIRAIRSADGSVVWRRELTDTNARVAAAGGGRLFVTVSRCARPEACDAGADWWPVRGALLALDAGTGRILWDVPGETDTPRPLWNVNALANGLLFVSGTRQLGDSLRDRIAVLSAARGRLLWSRERRGSFVSIAAVADGRVYAHTAQGGLGGRVLAFGLPSPG